MGVTSLASWIVAWLCWTRRTDLDIQPVDWLFLGGALAGLPLWYLASDPLAAVVVVTLVDMMGFGPTFRKVYRDPHGESMVFFALMALRNGLSVFALERLSWTTALFPTAVTLVCLVLLAMAEIRRRKV